MARDRRRRAAEAKFVRHTLGLLLTYERVFVYDECMVDGLAAVVDRLVGCDVADLSDAGLCTEFVDISREMDRLEHRRAVVLLAIDRRGIPSGVGAVSAAAWAQRQTGLVLRDAREALDAAAACESLPLTNKAWAQGEISASAARAIAQGRPDGHEVAYGQIEETLVDFAAARDCRSLHASIAYARRCADALDDREPQDLNGCRHSKVGDRWALSADLDDLSGTTFDKALRAATDPPTDADPRTADQRRAGGLVRMAQFFLGHENLPVEGGERPHVTIIEQWETIRDGVPSRSELGPSLSAADLATVACDAQIERIITGAKRQPLDIGRLAHDPPKAMRRAVAARDCRCRFPGCDRRPSWCDVHHIRLWTHGGETKVVNLVLLCSFHHHLIHRKGWRTTFDGDAFTVTAPDGHSIGTTYNAHQRGQPRLAAGEPATAAGIAKAPWPVIRGPDRRAARR
jgi:hypothetical protein